MNELKARGIQDVLIAVCDGLTGLPDVSGFHRQSRPAGRCAARFSADTQLVDYWVACSSTARNRFQLSRSGVCPLTAQNSSPRGRCSTSR